MAFPTEAIYNKCVDAINDIYGGGMVEQTRPWLEVNDTGYFSGIWSFIQAGCDVFMVIGVILTLIYLIINLSEKSITQGVTMESFMKCFIEFILALVLIMNSFHIIEFASSLGSGVLDDIGNIAQAAAGSDTGVASSLMAEVDEINTEQSGIGKFLSLLIIYLGQLMIPQLLANIGKALVVVACMSRGISIIIYGVFLPIPIADVYKDGLNSKGIRYIKKLIALFIQGAIILLVVMASSLLQGSVQQAVNGVASTILGMFYNIGLIFVTVMVIFKSQNIANDIVGA